MADRSGAARTAARRIGSISVRCSALGTNSRAYYPVLQLALDANGGVTLGRAVDRIVDRRRRGSCVTNKDFYPVGVFDDTIDGNSDPMHNMPLFRQDLHVDFLAALAPTSSDSVMELPHGTSPDA